MKVPKEIAEKAERYEGLKAEADQLYEELEEFAYENGFEDFWITGLGTVQKPIGQKQSDGEYCDQYMEGEDSGHGTYYYPIEGSTKYMFIEYSF